MNAGMSLKGLVPVFYWEGVRRDVKAEALVGRNRIDETQYCGLKTVVLRLFGSVRKRGIMDDLSRIEKYLERKSGDPEAYKDAIAICKEHVENGEKDWHKVNEGIRKKISGAMQSGTDVNTLQRLNEMYYNSLLLDARVSFDAYCQYLEKQRDPKKRFYLPRRKQLHPLVDAMQSLMDDDLDLLGISLPPGVGKLLADDTPVITKDGWKNHGDLKVGDYVVGMDGKYKMVQHVFEKGVADYEVEFTNHDKVKCHGNHEWYVWNRHRNKYEILTTREMAESRYEVGVDGKRGHRYMYLLPYVEPMEGVEQELPVDPYVFGAWLGDGTSAKPALTICDTDTVIVEEIKKHYKHTATYDQVGCKRYEFETQFRMDLQKMGLCQSRNAREKYIPEEYIRASFSQRCELLAGLIDTDGTKGRDGRYTISTVNENLREGVCQLLSTFGWRYIVVKYGPVTSSSGFVGKRPIYCILFCPKVHIPCRVERKKQSVEAARRRVAIKKIRKIDPVPGNCIQVEDGIYRVGKTMVPTHNSTLSIFFLTWIAGKYPDEPNLTGSHSNAFVRGVYDECLRIFDKNGEYLWHDVFPDVNVSNTNAKDYRIDLGKRKRFETLEFTSIGSGNAGLYRASRLLFCDDLISGIEIALSKERLDKLWETYTTDLRQRKLGDHCKELHVSTRWSVNDIVGRLVRQYEDSDRAKFIVVPALDENDESNFNYKYGVGFTTEFYHEQREIMDDASWRALYMNQPIEREGLLYHPDELRRYFELPDREPDAILCSCDTKDRGDDYCAMPIAYQYGQDYYIEDVVFNNANPEIVEAEIVAKLLKHKVHMGRFESNSAGGRIAQSVQEEVKRRGGRTKLTTKFTTQNKETKIVVSSPWAKEHFLFKDPSVIKDKEYRAFMNNVCSWTMSGKKVKHDDGPDSLAMLVDYAQSFALGQAQVFARPF